MKSLKNLLVPVLLVLLWSVTASAELVDRVAAVVNGDVIAFSEVQARAAPELARLNTIEPAKRAEFRQQILKRALEMLIGEKLMEAQVKELNIDISDADVEVGIDDVKRQNNIDGAQFEQLLLQEGYTMSAYRSFMKKQLARLRLVNLKVRSKVKISDEDLKAEYAKVSHDELADSEVHARHILVQLTGKSTDAEVEAARLKAVALADEAKKPGVDFIELAKKKSEGPSAPDGGDLGFFKRGVMVPEFERAAFSLPVGGVSAPIRTKFGWHVIKVEEKRALEPKPFEELKEQLREKLLRGQLEKFTDQYVQELRAAAVVEVKI